MFSCFNISWALKETAIAFTKKVKILIFAPSIRISEHLSKKLRFSVIIDVSAKEKIFDK